MLKNLIVACALAVLTGAQAGCSSTGSQRIDKTASSLADLDALLDRGETEVDAVLTSMDFLAEAEDLDAAYKSFDRNVKALEKTADDVRDRRLSMEARAAEHVTTWQQEIQSLSGERARELSEQRRREFDESVRDVSAELKALREAYEPFLAKVRDVRLMLSNDLTRNGVQTAGPVMDNTRELAEEVRERSEDAREATREAREHFSR